MTCAIDGCAKPDKSRGLCSGHYQSESKAGRLAVHPLRRPPVRSYGGAHKLVARTRGPARQHMCTDCGESAQHWSYAGGAPDERQSPAGPFSTDPRFYEARCTACHGAYDRSPETCIAGHPFTAENTYVSPGNPRKRECHQCRRERFRRHKQRKAA